MLGENQPRNSREQILPLGGGDHGVVREVIHPQCGGVRRGTALR